MPNWTRNIITIVGNDIEVKKGMDFVKGETESGFVDR